MQKISQPQNQKPLLKTKIPGPLSRALREREDAHLAPGLQNFALMAGLAVTSAQGSAVTDVDGNVFLDLIGGIGVGGLGHSHPKFVKAIEEQVRLWSVGSFTSVARVELFEQMAQFAPSPELHRLQLYSSGAEAVESALRLAKSYTGRHEFVSFSGGYHGKTLGALSLMGSDFKQGLGPYAPGSHIVPYAHGFRKPKNLSAAAWAFECVDRARQQIKAARTDSIAAFIVEPMQGTAGNVIPPKEFLPAVAELAKEFGALLIADEMITGFGRTGRNWGINHSGITPDIITLGKQFGGGFPVSGVLTTDSIASAKPWSNPSGSSSSYGGNPMASAAAATSLKIINEEGLVENSQRIGEILLQGFLRLKEKYSFIADVRGAGLFLGIELVENLTTQEPLPKTECAKLFHIFLQKGLLTMAYAPSFRLQPAMTMDEATAMTVLSLSDEAFAEFEKQRA
jgi:4-aminobutyrate aminotransferase-like enzyme